MGRLLTAVVVVLIQVTALQAQVPVYDLPGLVEQSDVIAVVKVVSITPTDERVVTINEQDYRGHFKLATLESVCEIKGSIPHRFALSYSTISGMTGGGWSGGVPRGQSLEDTLWVGLFTPSLFRIVFLRKDGEGFQSTDGSHVAFPAAAVEHCGNNPDPIGLVIRELQRVAESDGTGAQEKQFALRQLYVSDEPSIVPFLRNFLASKAVQNDDRLRVLAVSALLHKGDGTILKAIVSDLLRGQESLPDPDYLYSIGSGDFQTEDIATLASLLKSPRVELRVAGARALRHIGGEVAAASLRPFVYDSDEDVRVNATQCIEEAKLVSH